MSRNLIKDNLFLPSDSGLVYPLAEPYVHDPTGDVSDDSFPAAEAYVHDTTGDAWSQ